MKKYLVEVSKIYFVKHVILADDEAHANEICSEISSEMDVNHTTFLESEWKVKEVGDDQQVSYEPIQGYLK